MLTNGCCTLYLLLDKESHAYLSGCTYKSMSQRTYRDLAAGRSPEGHTHKRVFCPAVHWEDTKGRNINKTGSASVDSVKVWIPLDAAELTGAAGYIVWGDCPFVPSEKRPMRELITTGKASTITSVARLDFGRPRMRHWEVYAK